MSSSQRSNNDLLSELRDAVENRPRWRLHVHPDAVMWIAISVNNTGLSQHVTVVGDPDCPDLGKGWIEAFTPEQWQGLRALVGQRVTAVSADLETMSGTLLRLDDREAQLDLGAGDVRYMAGWIALQPADD